MNLNSDSSGAAFNRQINLEAADWFVEFSTGEPDERMRREFDSWLRASPQHVRAYLELFPIWQDTLGLAHAEQASATECIALARASGNVRSLASTFPSGVAARGDSAQALKPVRAFKARWLAFAAMVAICIVGAALLAYAERGVYRTGIGEQRLIALGDGSTIELNARSMLKVRYSQAVRLIELRRGQALFKVAKDAARPFIVDAQFTRVRAVGTQFDVYRKSSGTVVTVLEGRVAVSSGGLAHSGGGEVQLSDHGAASALRAGPGDTILLAGEQIAVTSDSAVKPNKPDVSAATAWLRHEIVFSGTPLGDVVEEFNRYNERRLVIRDEALESLQISGVFSATDLPSLIRFLRAQPGVRVTESEREIRIDTH